MGAPDEAVLLYGRQLGPVGGHQVKSEYPSFTLRESLLEAYHRVHAGPHGGTPFFLGPHHIRAIGCPLHTPFSFMVPFRVPFFVEMQRTQREAGSHLQP